MKRSHHPHMVRGNESRAEAFTRIELVSVCAALGVLALLVLPALAANKPDSERMVCFNNLRLVGRGVQAWSGDHNQQLPWWLPVADGGQRTSTVRAGNAWFEYAFMSNELVTPKILACPSDVGVKRADNWSQFTGSATFRSLALSYSLSMHASTDAPESWLSADRNFFAGVAASCPVNVNGLSSIDGTYRVPASYSPYRWTNAVHGTFGHFLTVDGSAEFTSNQRLREIMAVSSDTGAIHFLRAR